MAGEGEKSRQRGRRADKPQRKDQAEREDREGAGRDREPQAGARDWHSADPQSHPAKGLREKEQGLQL